MQKSVLVTGGFGFIGTSLLERLIDEEPNTLIHVVDDLSASPILVEDYLDTLGRPRNLSYDFCTIQQFFDDRSDQAWDAIYHLASPVGPAGVLPHAGNLVRQVVDDAYVLIDHCLTTGAKLLDVSTSEVYGGGQDGYCTELTPMVVPSKTTVRLEYAIAKLAAETAIMNSVVAHGLNATIVRPFNVAGPRQSPRGGFVLPRFVQQAAAGLPLTVFGDGSAVRAFTHVRDMAKGLRMAMDSGGRGEIYNLGNPANRTTVLALAKLVKTVTESASEIHFVDPKAIYGPLYEEASDKFPEAGKAVAKLGWTPRHDIRSVVEDCWAEHRRQVSLGRLKDTI